MLWVKWSRSMVCSGARGGGMLRAKRLRLRVKRLSGIEGEAVEVTVFYRGEQSRACSVGGGVL
jgi:hypothetical protein